VLFVDLVDIHEKRSEARRLGISKHHERKACTVVASTPSAEERMAVARSDEPDLEVRLDAIEREGAGEEATIFLPRGPRRRLAVGARMR
jgi:hypothetical protein